MGTNIYIASDFYIIIPNMNYIIDAFNTGYKIPAVARLIRGGQIEAAIDLLIHNIRLHLPGRGMRIILVVDGRPRGHSVPGQKSGVEIRYSRAPLKADHLIQDFIRREKRPADWTVVSADHEIQNTARDQGAAVITPGELLRAGPGSKKKKTDETGSEKPSATNIDVAYWKKLFEAGDDESG